MKLHYYYTSLPDFNGKPDPYLPPRVEIIGKESTDPNEYSEYLANYLGNIAGSTGTPAYPPTPKEWCEDVIAGIESIEKSETEHFEDSAEPFYVDVSRDVVRVSADWSDPDLKDYQASFSFNDFKTAIQGLKRFLDMPERLGSELTVELQKK